MENQQNDKTTKILLISGRSQSGKDTSANFLIKEKGFRRLAFADPLKESVSREWKLELSSLHDQSQKELPLLNMPVVFETPLDTSILFDLSDHFRTQDGHRANGFNFDYTDNLAKNESGQTLYWTRRALMVFKGKMNRVADKQYWIKLALEQIKEGDRVVITDCRYPNEAQVVANWAKERGFDSSVIRIERPSIPRINEDSESSMDQYPFDSVYINSGSLEDLYKYLSSLPIVR
jgi:hypothetical protein